MIDNISIIMPCEEDRFDLLLETLLEYRKQGFPIKTEFIIVSRTIDDLKLPGMNIRVIKYEWNGKYFNPAMALNIGVNNSIYENILITCPEVKPKTKVIEQLSTNVRGNYVCQVYDQDSSGKEFRSLVNKSFRGNSPAMYFMACFKKEDLYKINGWDERFMEGYAWEDSDFGNRWLRANLPFEIKEGIQGVHLYHPRGAIGESWNINKAIYDENNAKNITFCEKGLVKRNE